MIHIYILYTDYGYSKTLLQNCSGRLQDQRIFPLITYGIK